MNCVNATKDRRPMTETIGYTGTVGCRSPTGNEGARGRNYFPPGLDALGGSLILNNLVKTESVCDPNFEATNQLDPNVSVGSGALTEVVGSSAKNPHFTLQTSLNYSQHAVSITQQKLHF